MLHLLILHTDTTFILLSQAPFQSPCIIANEESRRHELSDCMHYSSRVARRVGSAGSSSKVSSILQERLRKCQRSEGGGWLERNRVTADQRFQTAMMGFRNIWIFVVLHPIASLGPCGRVITSFLVTADGTGGALKRLRRSLRLMTSRGGWILGGLKAMGFVRPARRLLSSNGFLSSPLSRRQRPQFGRPQAGN